MVKGNIGTVNGKRVRVRVRKRRGPVPKGFKGGPGRPVFVIKKRGSRKRKR